MERKFFTSESVADGHPDKVCDAIADSVLDECLAADPYSRVACECTATTGMVLVMGEITTKATLDVPAIARRVIGDIGYNKPGLGFDAESCAVIVALDKQSPDIALGVDRSYEAKAQGGDAMDTGAGDQGMMFGYASDETDEYMPLAIYLAHALTRRLSEVRKSGLVPFLRPDGKAQVTVEYDGDKPKRIDTVVVSAQHDPEATAEMIREALVGHVIMPVLPKDLIDAETKIYTNPTGRFVVGGPHGDSGLTGRKIIVDTYGGYARHGGGAFSGKDPTKVDRSSSYMARYIAKNIVAAGLASRCELQLAYAIGVAQPVMVGVDTAGTGKVSDEKLTAAVRKLCDLRPEAIIRKFDLRRPMYAKIMNFGHFGDPSLPWEKLDLADALKAEVQQ